MAKSEISPRRIVAVALGSYGDIHPFLGLARAFQARGHDVEMLANEHYEALVRSYGVRFSPIGRADDLAKLTEDPKMWQPRHGVRLISERLILPNMRPVYEKIEALGGDRSTLVLAPVTVFGARIAQEALGVRLATIHLQPVTLRSAEDAPGLPLIPRSALLNPAARYLRRGLFALADRWLFDPALEAPTNAFRRELRLAPIRHPLRDWIHSPDLGIGLFPEWFAPPQRDWPPGVQLTGFPLFDSAEESPVSVRLQEFLAAGSAPVVFTPGTAMRFARRFFEVSLEACRRVGLRGVFLTRFGEQVPPLSNGFAHFDYVPLSRLLPRAAALVYHGGIGSASQALAAGVPHLVSPLSYDQPDNAARLERLGVGRTIFPPLYNSRRAARALQELLGSESVAAACGELKRQITYSDPLGATCDMIEQLS